MTDSELHVVRVEQHDHRLGRQIVHDPASRGFPFAPRRAIDRSLWRDRRLRIYDPLPNPNQDHGNCTGCSKANMFNTVGNRVAGRVLHMPMADKIYSLATTLDPWDGVWPPTDTGSSGLAASKAAQQLGLGGEYRWLFGGADEVVQAIMEGHPVSVGAYWYAPMFTNPYADGKPLTVSGDRAGGHQWTAHGYWKSRDYVLGRCWWGSYRDFWIRRVDLQRLLDEDGDAHVQARLQPV
jgi:hypothetical protein